MSCHLRIWRLEGLKVPKKQPKRGRLWLNDGSCIRLRPEHKNHVWAYDFVATRTHDGRPVRMLAVIDEYTHLEARTVRRARKCLAIRAARTFKSNLVLESYADTQLTRSPDSTIDT